MWSTAWAACVPPCCWPIWFMRWCARRTFNEQLGLGAAGPLSHNPFDRFLAFGHLGSTYQFWPPAAVAAAAGGAAVPPGGHVARAVHALEAIHGCAAGLQCAGRAGGLPAAALASDVAA